jgi:hypothetical protein
MRAVENQRGVRHSHYHALAPRSIRALMATIVEWTPYLGILFVLSLVAYFLIRIITHRH